MTTRIRRARGASSVATSNRIASCAKARGGNDSFLA